MNFLLKLIELVKYGNTMYMLVQIDCNLAVVYFQRLNKNYYKVWSHITTIIN